MQEITLATQTTFAELLQRCLDADFDESFRERGQFKRRLRKGRYYWYYQWDAGGKKRERYVGPVTDRAISERVERFAGIKSDFKGRQEMVRALSASGLPTPDPISALVVEAMWKAGFFRLRGVLVGTVAYQAYAGPLGIRISGRPLQTQDVDFAQFWGISENIGESMPPVLDVLRAIDPSFSEVPRIDDPLVTTAYRNRDRYRVEFLTPARGSEDHRGRPAKMKALGGAGAQPLRHLDYLIHQPERSVLLHGGGIPVTIPRAERYAVHKLIVSGERQDQVKSIKDVAQAAMLIEALRKRRPMELATAWSAAREMGPRWREKLDAGRERLEESARAALDDAIARAAALKKRRKASR